MRGCIAPGKSRLAIIDFVENYHGARQSILKNIKEFLLNSTGKDPMPMEGNRRSAPELIYETITISDEVLPFLEQEASAHSLTQVPPNDLSKGELTEKGKRVLDILLDRSKGTLNLGTKPISPAKLAREAGLQSVGELLEVFRENPDLWNVKLEVSKESGFSSSFFYTVLLSQAAHLEDWLARTDPSNVSIAGYLVATFTTFSDKDQNRSFLEMSLHKINQELDRGKLDSALRKLWFMVQQLEQMVSAFLLLEPLQPNKSWRKFRSLLPALRNWIVFSSRTLPIALGLDSRVRPAHAGPDLFREVFLDLADRFNGTEQGSSQWDNVIARLRSRVTEEIKKGDNLANELHLVVAELFLSVYIALWETPDPEARRYGLKSTFAHLDLRTKKAVKGMRKDLRSNILDNFRIYERQRPLLRDLLESPVEDIETWHKLAPDFSNLY